MTKRGWQVNERDVLRAAVATINKFHLVGPGARITGMTNLNGGMPGAKKYLLITEAGKHHFAKVALAHVDHEACRRLIHEILVNCALLPIDSAPNLRYSEIQFGHALMVTDYVIGHNLDASDYGQLRTVGRYLRYRGLHSRPFLGPYRPKALVDSAASWVSVLRELPPAKYSLQRPTWNLLAQPTAVVSLLDEMAGDRLCHWDLRADNILFDHEERITLVDWGLARIGPPWADPFKFAVESSAGSNEYEALAELFGLHLGRLRDLAFLLADTYAMRAAGAASYELKRARLSSHQLYLRAGYLLS